MEQLNSDFRLLDVLDFSICLSKIRAQSLSHKKDLGEYLGKRVGWYAYISLLHAYKYSLSTQVHTSEFNLCAPGIYKLDR